MLTAVSMAGSGLLLLPSMAYSLARLLGHPSRQPIPVLHRLRPGWLILLVPILLFLGQIVTRVPTLAYFSLPFFHFTAISLPVWWLVSTAVRRLPIGAPQRVWGVFSSGLVLAPGIALVLEGIAALVLLLVVSFALASQPGVVEEIMDFANWFSRANPSPPELLDRLSPIMLNPAVIAGVLALIALIVPMIEELVKPVGVWLLLGRNLSAVEGFAAGALSGAGYALFENLALVADSTAWAAAAAVRVATGAVHIFTSGLMGWALAKSWRKKRFFLLGLAYLAAILVHGLWNGLTVLTSLSTIASSQGKSPLGAWMNSMQLTGPVSLGILALGALLALFSINRTLSRAYSKRLANLQSKQLSNAATSNPPEMGEPATEGALTGHGADPISD